MKKRILSMTLALSIVASLFAGLSFSASATEYTNYTAAGANGKANIADTGKDATKSLIGDKLPIGTYYYNTYSSENGIAIAEEPTAFLSNIDPIGDGDRYIGNLTSETNLTSSATIFDSETYMKYMWAKYEDGLVSELINDETKRWAQLNYELDGEATINTFIFGALSTSGTFASYFWQMPGHYKVIFSNTEEGLFDHSKATAVIDVDETKNATFQTNRHTVTLNTPITAKYVGFRMICGFNTKSIGVAKQSNIYMDRFMHFSVFGEYTTPAVSPEGDATATVKDLDGNVITGIDATALISTVGNNDDANNYASAGVKLNVAKNAEVGGKYYAFQGWYLGEELVADKAVADYAFTGAEENMNFVAKYVKTYKPYTDYTAAGKSNVGDLNDIGKDPERSLILDKAPYEGYFYNTIENDKNIAVTEEPTKFNLNNDIALLTDADLTSQGTTFKSTDYTKYMWAEYDPTTTIINKLINDETKRWSQINYELDGQATINTFVYGVIYAGVGGQYWHMPGHYKLIFSDTKEGLFDLEKANAVIEVDETQNAEFKKNRHTVTLNTPVTAKYVGLRMICGFNTGSVGHGSCKENSMYMDRVSHFGVYGTYTADLDAEVNVATEEGVPSTLVSKSYVVYIGNVDDNGNYGAANVTVTADEYTEDEDTKLVYTFAGWYNGDELVSANAEYVYNLANGTATLTAKYVVEEICVKKGHTGGTATCVSKAVCGNCGEEYGELNPNGHKYTNYVYNNNATCKADGTKTAKCDYGCGKGTHTVTAVGTKKAHSYTRTYVASKATLSADGIIRKACACGAYINSGKISKIKTVKLSYTSKSYTGKSLKPSVSVKDSAGKTVTASNYTVKYSNNKKVGKATVTVTFKGNYSGTKKLTFKIVPKKTSISSLKAGKKLFTVKYKKQTSGTGYEIQYSTSKSFKGAKTAKISKNKTVSKTIKKLKSKKTYYVRVRVTKGSSYKSSWSAVKKVKVK